MKDDVAAYGIQVEPGRGVTDYAELIQGAGIRNRFVSFKTPVGAGSVFVIDTAIRRADWLTEDIDYVGHFERPLIDQTLEIRVQVIRWNDHDPFEPPSEVLYPLARAQ